MPSTYTGQASRAQRLLSRVITGVANGGPGDIEITTSVAHGYQTGDRVVIHGVGGAIEANNAPGTWWTITVTGASDGTSTTFTLDDSSLILTGLSYTSGGYVRDLDWAPAFSEISDLDDWSAGNINPPGEALADRSQALLKRLPEQALVLVGTIQDTLATEPSSALAWSTTAGVVAAWQQIANDSLPAACGQITSSIFLSISAVDSGSGVARITTPVPHGLSNGDQVVIEGLVTNAALNGVWRVGYISATQFVLLGSTYTANETPSAATVMEITNLPRANDGDIFEITALFGVAQVSGTTSGYLGISGRVSGGAQVAHLPGTTAVIQGTDAESVTIAASFTIGSGWQLINITNTAGVVTVTDQGVATLGANASAIVVQGQLRIANATNAANNGEWPIVAFDSTTHTFTIHNPAAVTESSTPAVGVLNQVPVLFSVQCYGESGGTTFTLSTEFGFSSRQYRPLTQAAPAA